MHVCVVGAGIVGMSTAVEIQKKAPGTKVTVISSSRTPSVTSNVAAGFFEPHLFGQTPTEKIMQWASRTWSYISALTRKPDSRGAGTQSGWQFNKQKIPVPFWAPLVYNFNELSEEEVRRATHLENVKHGFFFTTLFLETKDHLAYLEEKFLSAGGSFVDLKLDSLQQAVEITKCDAVVNCCGLGAAQLVADTHIRPVRGQVIRVRCPQVKHFYLTDQSYILMNSDSLVVGGTHEMDEWDTTVDQATADQILQRARKVCPALETATILSHHVGLRPYREKGVRLEKDTITVNGKKVAVVHNYGHGGCGITLFQGCAEEATQLLLDTPVAKL